MADMQDDMTAVVKFIHEQCRAQIKPEFALEIILTTRDGQVAAAGDVPAPMLPDVFRRVLALAASGDSTKLIVVPGGFRN